MPAEEPSESAHQLVLVEIRFEDEPGWSVGLEGFVGLASLFGTDTRGAYSLAGGALRGRYRFIELGPYFEATDTLSGGGHWKSFGAYAGAYLPYQNWVDFQIGARLGSRVYSDSDTRYGVDGYKLGGAALGLVLGVSDRAKSGLFGGRVGSQLVTTYDLKQRDRDWRLESADPDTGVAVVTTGTTHVGGFSAALFVTVALDVGEGP